ncbi:DHA2 family efflux MFS transporter permease subunit [Rhodococcoides kyotonense]|uniref:Drug resistance transporter, EmrB/QacA subfamily n=1 Tax=Rhodococcoides kyotonense TaxID=398843 RepID=A0A239KH57_9NOCA|nr:DHA2 family efflux MFS transporter permease subunit [Rhodococcus kyotonensis]SNT17320.1 drug resistance transporter, EmrB/QacA subfamily [Rhodococcus kyotonensis]
MTVKSVADGTPDRLDRRTQILVTVLGAAAFVAVLDGTAVTASLGTLTTSFDTTLPVVVWVTTGYLLAAGSVLPLVGWAVDRFGGRAVFLAGLGAFVAGSVLTGLAWSIEALIVFRVLQGFGGGLVEPASIAVAAAVAPREHVGRVMGRFSLIINIAPVVGPLLGTLFADNGLWRMIFLINLPLGALIVLAAVRWVPTTTGSTTPQPPDLLGMALLAPGFVFVLLTVNRWGAGADAYLVVPLVVVGAVLLGAYVVHALRTSRVPVLDLRLLRTPAFAAALLVMCVVGFIMFSQLSMLPLLAEQQFGLHGIARGVITSALGVGLLFSMSNAGRISDRVGPRPLVVGGSVLTALGLGAVGVVYDAWPLPALLVLYVVVGLGFGCVASPSFASVYRILPPESAAQGTTALFIAVQLFASVGVTVMGLLLDRGGDSVYSTVFTVLAVAATAAAVIGTRLPGRP